MATTPQQVEQRLKDSKELSAREKKIAAKLEQIIDEKLQEVNSSQDILVTFPEEYHKIERPEVYKKIKGVYLKAGWTNAEFDTMKGDFLTFSLTYIPPRC